MQSSIDELIVVIGVVTALSVAFAKAFGPYQTEISQAVIDAFAVPSSSRRLVNMGVGIVIGVAFTAIGAAAIGAWGIVPAGVLAGVLASVEASRTHDQANDYTAGFDDAQQLLRRRTTIGRNSVERE